jgi:hypothetical protein
MLNEENGPVIGQPVDTKVLVTNRFEAKHLACFYVNASVSFTSPSGVSGTSIVTAAIRMMANVRHTEAFLQDANALPEITPGRSVRHIEI